MPTRSPFAMPGRDQPAGQRVDVAVELGVGPAPPGGDLDQRLAVGVRRDGALEVGPDRLLEQGGRRSLRRRRTPCPQTSERPAGHYPSNGEVASGPCEYDDPGEVRRDLLLVPRRATRAARSGACRGTASDGRVCSTCPCPCGEVNVSIGRSVVPAHLDERLVAARPDLVPAALERRRDQLLERVAVGRVAVHLLGGDVGELAGGHQVAAGGRAGRARRGRRTRRRRPTAATRRRSTGCPGRSTGMSRAGRVRSRAPGLTRDPPGGRPPWR